MAEYIALERQNKRIKLTNIYRGDGRWTFLANWYGKNRGIIHNTLCLRHELESPQILPAAVELCPNHSPPRPCTGQRLLQPCALKQAGKTVQWVVYPAAEMKPRVKKNVIYNLFTFKSLINQLYLSEHIV